MNCNTPPSNPVIDGRGFKLSRFYDSENLAVYKNSRRVRRQRNLFSRLGTEIGTMRMSWDAELEAWTTIEVVYECRWDCMREQREAA